MIFMSLFRNQPTFFYISGDHRVGLVIPVPDHGTNQIWHRNMAKYNAWKVFEIIKAQTLEHQIENQPEDDNL